MTAGVLNEWRKREGVEPTRDRLAAPPGFEVRTPHRGRFSSLFLSPFVRALGEQVKPAPVDAAQIAAAQGDAVAVEELQKLDGDLGAGLGLIAKFRGGGVGGRGAGPCG